jgi:uncharacterized protein (DUF1501 family)
MPTHTCCDGIGRRDFLRIGALAGLGLQLPGYLWAAESGQISEAKAKSAIFVFLSGGPSHLDTFDLKPSAPDTHRGEFRETATNVPGVRFCEHLPQLARCADKFALLRGVSHTVADHRLGTRYMTTGNRPLPSLEFPSYGTVVSKELPCDRELPPYVAVPSTPEATGYLGVQYGPLNTSQTPKAGQPVELRGLSLGGLTISDIDRRHNLLKKFDTAFAPAEKESALLQGLDRFSQQVYSMLRSNKTRNAFDLSKESPAVSKMFADTPFAQSCLLATRLVENGVRFVTVTLGGWDTHQDNFASLKDKLLPTLDGGLSALFQGLAAKGLLDSTVVMVTGEFGRTPKINPRAGRDHYPRAMCCLLAGGGIKGGQVVGASDKLGMEPAEEAIPPDNVAATFYRCLGIDVNKEYYTPTGRPLMIVRNGRAIEQLAPA